jgi:hypothetical protein
MRLTSRAVITRLVFTIFLSASPAYGQADFTNLKARSGDIVFVTRLTGTTISGPLGAISASSITVNQETIPYEPGLKIAREGDRLWNGIIIGAAIGVAAGVTIGAEACLDESIAPCATGGAAVWAGIGALVDWLHKGRTTIFEAPRAGKPSVRLTPAIGLDRKKVDFVLSF